MPDTPTDRPPPDAGFTLAGRRAFVTGGTTGIGRAIAMRLAGAGARVFITGRDPHHLDDALAQIGRVGEVGGVTLDLSEADNVSRFVEQAEQWLGGIDVAIINAGIAAGGLADISEADLRVAISVNFTAYLLAAKAATDRMLAVGSGDIVFTGSLSAHMLAGSSSVYSGIKYGIQGFTEALRRELGPRGIRVGVVEPGKTSAEMQRSAFSPEQQRDMIAKGEMLQAEDIAAAVHFMLVQPRRAVVQQLTIAPVRLGGE